MLVVVTVAVGTVHRQLGMARIDADLTRAMRSVSGVVDSEVNERFDLAIGAIEALHELELPGMGVTVLDSTGQLLATRTSSAPKIDVPRLGVVGIDGPPETLEPERVRVAASRWRHGSHVYTVVSWVPLESLDREHRTVMNTIQLAIPFAALAGLIGGWVVVSRALRPLSAMARHADAIDRRHLNARLLVPEPPDELRRLALAFNALLGRLSDAVGAQRTFMTEASHELRTPVSVLRTTAQVTLSKPTRGETEYREALEIVAGQAGRLTQVVDDMFLLALADVDGRALVMRHLYLDELLNECVRAIRVLADGHDIRITLDTPEGLQMRGDEELLKRLALNLLDNAVRYSPDGSEVRVKVVVEQDTLSVAVCDSGSPIPASEHERVFERFVRLETARPTSGGGLGLPIARWIAEHHGGTLELRTDPSGNRFVATFPRARAGGGTHSM